MDVSVSSADGSSLVRLTGEVDTYTVPDVRAAFESVALAPGATVVVDLRDVTFIDSSGLGAVIGLYHRARAAGATDMEIHDTVLIAAAFCMYNRYVDGLGTEQPRDEAMYRERGKRVAREGYVTVSKEYLPAVEAR